MEKVLTVLAFVIALMCAAMVGYAWNDPTQVLAWSIAMVGWIGAGFGILDSKE